MPAFSPDRESIRPESILDATGCRVRVAATTLPHTSLGAEADREGLSKGLPLKFQVLATPLELFSFIAALWHSSVTFLKPSCYAGPVQVRG